MEKINNYIGLATIEIYIYNIDAVNYKDRETGKDNTIYRAFTSVGIITINDDVAKQLQAADMLTPALFSASSYVKDGVTRYNIIP